MRDLSGRNLALFAVAIVLAAVLVWQHHPAFHSGKPQSTVTAPQSVLYGQKTTVHILGAVLEAPLCQQQQIPAAACAKLPETVTFTDPVAHKTVAVARTRTGTFSVSFPIVIGRDYHVQAATVWNGASYQSQQNDFLIGRPAPLNRILLSY